MVRIRKEKGGSGVGPYWWPEEDPVCEVPEELARDLLARPDEGWSLEPDPEPEEPASEGEDSGEGDGEKEPELEAEGEPGDGGEENAEGQGEEKKPAAKPAARRSRAKGAPA